MRDKYGVAQDSYCYNSSDVLKNKLNITDYEELSQAELESSTLDIVSIHQILSHSKSSI